MAASTIRTTYALDAETVDRLKTLAREWNVSKSEALRRVIKSARVHAESRTPAEALDRVQHALALTPPKVAAWATRLKRERRQASAKRETRA